MRRSISPRRASAAFVILSLLAGLLYWLLQPSQENVKQPDPFAVQNLEGAWDVQTDPRITGSSFVENNGPAACMDEITRLYTSKLDSLNSDQIHELIAAHYPFFKKDADVQAAKVCTDQKAINTYKIAMLDGKITADEIQVEMYKENNPTQLPWQLEARLAANKSEVTRLQAKLDQLKATA